MKYKKEFFKKLSNTIIYFFILAMLVVCFYIFQGFVKDELHNQAVSEITELTRQGAVTLQVQLESSFKELHQIAATSKISKENIDELLNNYRSVDEDIYIYFENANKYSNQKFDSRVFKGLKNAKSDKNEGIINPHTSSVNGTRVFNIYVPFRLSDGEKAFLVKEFKINDIVDSFNLKYYGNSGFTYIADSKGEIIIRPINTVSNLTMHNIFDALEPKNKNSNTINQLKEYLKTGKSGWGLMNFQGEQAFISYRPIGYENDWYLVSIILSSEINKEANTIIANTLLLISIVMALAVILFFVSLNNKLNAEKKVESQALYMLRLFDSLPTGVIILEAVMPYNSLSINKAGLRLLANNAKPNNSKKELNNNCIRSISILDSIYNKDKDKMQLTLANVAGGAKKQSFDCRIKQKDSSIKWISGLVEKSYNSNNNEILILSFRDVTDSKLVQIRNELIQQQEKTILVTAVSKAYPIIVAIDLEEDSSQFVYSEYKLPDSLIYTKKYSLLYEKLLKVVHSEHLEEFKDKFEPESLKADLQRENISLWADIKLYAEDDGLYHWFSLQAIPIKDKKGIKAVFLAKNSDEQKQEEERQRAVLKDALMVANAANEAKSQFLSGMSHDIRTPMNAIMGLATIIATRLEDKEFIKESLDKIMLSSKHLLSLINNILDMSKIESGKISINKELFNYTEFIEKTIDLVRPQADNLKINLEAKLGNIKYNYVKGDILRLRQIYLNILSNAVKYTRANGKVYIEIKDEATSHKNIRNYIFICRDNGIGMEEEFLNHLFEPFERAKDTTVSRITGTGLGMAITKNLIDILGGSIQVESEINKGSEFTVTIPLEITEDKADTLTNEPIKIKKSYKGHHVLLADDNSLNREILKTILEEYDLEVDEAENGKEAINMLEGSRENYYDIIFMDIMMPILDGYEATKAIRKLNRKDARYMPIVAVTANAFESDMKKAFRAGINEFYSKPLEIEKLEELLDRHIK